MKGAPIYAKSFLQKIIADLSCYTETIALQSAAKQAMSVRNFFEKLQLKLAEPILIPMDTFVTLAAMGLSSYSRKCRHLLIKYPVRRTFRKIRDMVSSTRSTQNCNWRNIYSRILWSSSCRSIGSPPCSLCHAAVALQLLLDFVSVVSTLYLPLDCFPLIAELHQFSLPGCVSSVRWGCTKGS